jgi:tetratricopeptide (TPR) repeat protein
MPEQAQQEPGSLELFGSCYEGLGRMDEANTCADRLLAIDPSSAPALNLKGTLAYKKGDRTAAERFFKRASESDPGYGEPLTNLGVMRWADHEQEEGLDFLERGFLLSPTTTDSVTLYYNAVVSLAEFSRAELIFREAKSLHPRNKRVFFLFIDLLLQQGKYQEAMQEVGEALLTFDLDDGLLPAALQIREKIGEQQLPPPTQNRGTLSLCLIVKDEEAHLAKCLMSAKDIADEMIVVDTGSTDKTKDIATAFGARVFDFIWTDDFSEARNFSLSKASGDWILVLDGDETLSPADHAALADIVHSKPGKPAAYSLTTRNYTNLVSAQGWTANDGRYTREETGTGWHPSTKVRLFSNDPRIRFRDPVHEVVEPSLLEAGIHFKPCSIPVHHYGKMNAGKTAAKGEDYYLLGRKKLEETGGEAKAIQELAVQASELQRYGESVELWQKLIDLQPNNASAYFNMGFSHLKLKNYQEALRVSKKALELNPNLKEAVLNYANSELVIGDIDRAITSLSDVLQRVPDYPPAIGLLAASLFVKGDRQKALGHFQKLDKMGYNCVDYLYDLADMLASERRDKEAVQLLEAAIESNNRHQETLTLLAHCRAMIEKNDHQPMVH